MKPSLYALTDAEHATVLAALRDYQDYLTVHGAPRADLHDIATNGGAIAPLDDDQVDRLCESLNHEGLTFGEVVNLLGDDEQAPHAAGANKHRLVQEGTLEVDPVTVVSRSADGGAYVMCWLWVSDELAGVEPEPTGMQEG
jgi:hypothetical protein